HPRAPRHRDDWRDHAPWESSADRRPERKAAGRSSRGPVRSHPAQGQRKGRCRGSRKPAQCHEATFRRQHGSGAGHRAGRPAATNDGKRKRRPRSHHASAAISGHPNRETIANENKEGIPIRPISRPPEKAAKDSIARIALEYLRWPPKPKADLVSGCKGRLRCWSLLPSSPFFSSRFLRIVFSF